MRTVIIMADGSLLLRFAASVSLLCFRIRRTGPQLMWDGWPRYHTMSGRAEDFSSSPEHPDWVWGTPTFPFSGYQRAISPGGGGGSGQGMKVTSDHTPTCSAEVKNIWT